VLTDQEQKSWNDIEDAYAAEAQDRRAGLPPPRWRGQDGSELDDIPAAVVAGCWITIALILFGAPVAGLALAVVTVLVWWWSRCRPPVRAELAATDVPPAGEVGARE
jgi:hypothetical protein